MQWTRWGVVLSVAFHAGVALAVARLPKSGAQKSMMIAVAESKKKDKSKAEEDKPEPPKPEPPKPIRAPQPLMKRAPPPPSPADNHPPPPPNPSPAVAPPSPAMAALPDLGISMSNAGGPGGIAVAAAPAGGGEAAAPKSSGDAPKTAAPKPKEPAADDCAEAEVKPKPLGAVQPAYTDAARAANIEGKVRVRLRIDASGNVVDATIAGGLGYGLDEAAIAAAKRMKFTPASRCGRAVESSFMISMRFALGD